MKTILHMIDTTGPGGAETVFIDLATRLPKDKFRAVVVIRGEGWVYDELCRRGVTPILIDAKGSFNWRYLQQLCRLIKKERVDLIQSHLLGANVYSAMAGLLTRTPVVATFHGAVDIGDNERLKGLKFGAINAGAKCIVAVSDSLKMDIVNRTPLKQNKIKTIYNGINAVDFQRPGSVELRERFGWSSDVVIVGSLGNIRSAKGYDVLLHAAAILKKQSSSFRFVIAGQGKGELYDKLIRLRGELGLEEVVHFLGFIDDPASYLANIDIFLLSSTTEGFSIATIQAMASALPVIATKSGGPEEIITHADNGWLIEAGNPGEIAKSIALLTSDQPFATQMAKKGRQHVLDTFDMNIMLAAYQKAYGV